MISKNKMKYIRSLEMKKYRKANGVFVAEGNKLVGDLLKVFKCQYLVATDRWLDEHEEQVETLVKMGAEVEAVTDDELRRISFQETPQNVLAVFYQPKWSVEVNRVASENLCLLLDDVQNPGNLGTIVRIADWFGIEHIFCSRGCADIFNPKTVQATMGGLAHVQVHEVDILSLLDGLDSSIPVYGTFLDGDNIYEKQLGVNGLVVMGNEGKGVSKDVERYVNERLYIPNYPVGRETSESLNVAIATAIVCAEFRRR